MSEIVEILKIQTKKYRKMKPQDVIKLVYQGEFGGSHIASDLGKVFFYIEKELSETESREDEARFEYIGNGLYRLNFAAAKDLSAKQIAEAFIASAKEVRGSKESFDAKIKEVAENFEEFGFSFSKEELLDFYRECAENGYPKVSHSEEYRSEYRPAYRIITEKYKKQLG